MDLWGPFSTASLHNHKYFLTIVDDFSRFTWVIMLKGKFEAQRQIERFIQLVENQFGARVKTVRSDNGPEFILPSFYASKGILHQCSCVETPQQNGRVERKHQDILNVARALLFQSCLPKHFWNYAVLHATYLINRVLSKVLNNKTPYEALYGSLLDLSQLKVFGCLCFASTLLSHRSKFDPRSRKGVFLGYKSGQKGFVISDLQMHEILCLEMSHFMRLFFPTKMASNLPNHGNTWNQGTLLHQSLNHLNLLIQHHLYSLALTLHHIHPHQNSLNLQPILHPHPHANPPHQSENQLDRNTHQPTFLITNATPPSPIPSPITYHIKTFPPPTKLMLFP